MQVPEVRKFLKGLVIIDDVAFFGIAPHAERQARAEPDMDCEVAAVHLKTRHLLFRQRVGPAPCHTYFVVPGLLLRRYQLHNMSHVEQKEHRASHTPVSGAQMYHQIS